MKRVQAETAKRSRSIFTGMSVRVLFTGYAFFACLIKALGQKNYSNLFGWGVPIIFLGTVLLIIFLIKVPGEKEDEMVQKIYSKADSKSDIINLFGLLCIVVVTLCGNIYSQREIISTDMVLAMITGLMFIVSVIKMIITLVYSKKGI